jgi:hypothetical protein
VDPEGVVDCEWVVSFAFLLYFALVAAVFGSLEEADSKVTAVADRLVSYDRLRRARVPCRDSTLFMTPHGFSSFL